VLGLPDDTSEPLTGSVAAYAAAGSISAAAVSAARVALLLNIDDLHGSPSPSDGRTG